MVRGHRRVSGAEWVEEAGRRLGQRGGLGASSSHPETGHTVFNSESMGPLQRCLAEDMLGSTLATVLAID